MEQSKHYAMKILDNGVVDNNPLLDALKKCIKYISGSLLAVLVVIACYDDSPMLFVKIYGKNLLFYLAVLGFIATVVDTTSKKNQYKANVFQSHASATLYLFDWV